MTQNEAIEIREKLLAEQRRLNAAVKVLESDTCPTNAGIRMAISQYKARISLIDEEIRELADQIEPEVQTIQIDVSRTYKTNEIVTMLYKLVQDMAVNPGSGLYKIEVIGQ